MSYTDFDFPHTAMYTTDLREILARLMELTKTLNNFINLNTIKYANPIQWNITTQYEANTVVIDANTGTAYLSVQPVPNGVSITNTDYWTPIFTLDLLSANQNITLRDDGSNTLATFASSVDDWLIWNNTLYKVIQAINVNEAYVPGYNLTRYTVEMFINDYITAIKNLIGDLSDLDTTDKTSIVNSINELVASISDITTDISNLNITTPEMYGAVGDGVTDDTAAVQRALDNGMVILLVNKYKITSTLFMQGSKSVLGNGTIYGYLPESDPDEYLIVLGASSLGVTGDVFKGYIKGINFELHSGNYNNVIAGCNADNTVIKDCTFDCQNGNVHNKVIFFGNNAEAVPDNSDDENYLVDNVYFIFDNTPTTAQNPCENVSFELRKHFTISNCTVIHGMDDMGVHQCKDGVIIGNKLLENFQSRIFVSNSQDIKIINNTIQIAQDGICQGIQVCYEATYSNIPELKNIVIEGNIVDYSENTDTTTTYGMRLTGLCDSVIKGNILISNDNKHGRLVLETQPATGNLASQVLPNNNIVEGNIAAGISHTIAIASNDSVNYFYNNVAEYYIIFGSYDITDNNVLKATGASILTIAEDPQTANYNLTATFSGTPDGTEKPMLINGFPALAITRPSLLYPACMLMLDNDITLPTANTYKFTFYKNGTSIGTFTKRAMAKDYAAIAESNRYFAAGDVLTITLTITGSPIPATLPEAYQISTVLREYLDC